MFELRGALVSGVIVILEPRRALDSGLIVLWEPPKKQSSARLGVIVLLMAAEEGCRKGIVLLDAQIGPNLGRLNLIVLFKPPKLDRHTMIVLLGH